MTTRTATARYEGMGKNGKGELTTQSGVLDHSQYGFNTRFENGPGTNPEELIAAAHAGCFTMALSFALAKAGHETGSLETKCAITLESEGDGFTITKSALTLTGKIDGIDADEFRRLAEDAKQHCPVSKLINAETTLEIA
ncbi:osmotically inducible protein OsmC [Sphingomonas jinjuensis]|uniref:Osmotically inducible protein OsmC n=1 Tax=Sphingomonas jinjuensis TaxID=535907 RepID=A0A840F7T7_9SPHN|nr:OsmC family protein [Sphingomonas jinjuensis]MBB4153789.1 osmotically inducible protein OsmC [Sphingomonas jinjuensis]